MTDEAKVVEVIRTVSVRGKGTTGDVVRRVITYWTLEGEWLAENDPVKLDAAHLEAIKP